LFKASSEIRNAISTLDPYGNLLTRFLYHHGKGTIETDFKIEFENIKGSIKLLADNQSRIMEEQLKGNAELQQNAFELFAQGLLFDNDLDENGTPRRPDGEKVHMMDSSILGYVVWHAFIRLLVLLYDDSSNSYSKKWLQTDRNVGLAAGILAALIDSGREPVQSGDPTWNKPIDPALLKQYRTNWLSLSFKELDDKIVQLQQNTVSEHTGRK
jgi:hypothetical protein